MIEGLGKRLEALLTLRGMTRADLALKTGLTEAAISRYINDEREPKALAIAKMAEALRVRTDDILGIETEGSELDEAMFLIARNAKNISIDQKKALVNALIS